MAKIFPFSSKQKYRQTNIQANEAEEEVEVGREKSFSKLIAVLNEENKNQAKQNKTSIRI